MFRVSTHRRWALEGKKPKAPPKNRRTLFSSNALTAFAEDRRGTIALPFAFMLTAMCMLTGAAVDIGLWMQARNDTIEAMDAAVLAGLKKYQDTFDQSQALAAAQLAYTANTKNRASVVSDTVSFQFINNNTQIQATGDAYLAMNFLKIAGIAKMPLVKTDGSENSIAIAQAAAGLNMEVAIMIDNTGSMADTLGGNDTKISTVISAANSLVDTVVWADQSTYTSKIALIPFSEAVNLGSASMTNAARGTLQTTGGNGSVYKGNCSASGTGYGCVSKTAAPNSNSTTGWQGLMDTSARDDYGQSGAATFWASSKCVTERTGAHAYDDTDPTSAPVGALYNQPITASTTYWQMSSNTSVTYQDWCPIKATLMPLTSDKTALHNAINAMTPNGGTAGHLGTAWAWYALSPNFNSLWPSASNGAAPYSQLQVLNAKGQPVLKKIAILMTDGDYNFEYTNGVYDYYANASPTNDTSLNQAKALCTNMKAKGIEVYTIGAGVSSSAQTFLQSCATDASHFYNATNSASLTAAFKSITQKLVQLHLTH